MVTFDTNKKMIFLPTIKSQGKHKKIMNLKYTNLLVILIGIFSTFSLFSQNEVEKTNDLIKKFSKKDTVKKSSKLLPLAIPITEPAVGFGIIGGVMYNIIKKDSLQKPDMLAGIAGITTNGTWMAGGGYLGYWNEDSIRFTGFTGYGNIIMDYYGLGSEHPIQFDQEAFFLSQQLMFRLGESNFFLGGKYQLSTIYINQDYFPERVVDLDDLFKTVNSGVSIITEFDNLNHFLSPTKGYKIELSYDQNLEVIGSRKNWGTFNLNINMYLPVNDWWIPAFRIESHVATGSPPFYAYPYVSLRGIPALRYQGKTSLVVETEQLFNIAERWGVVGFTGIGTAVKSVEDDNNEIVWNAGSGIRFLASRSMGVKVGMDVARGPEEWAYYFTVGSAW